ncbi:GNAT family acetyltransferase [Sporanaerobium hydrogeniformans]|uniref:GNAT family acetyltransferase n=1 Tax=Sporanaerobium hydrogeniformans TaxID=3072179 RepID=A0AC61DC57_9FIRM|nr:ABC transporter permease [Sporanaerobium hydrogeniformans]PHV70346.1 GNAT family acetyltransferase [Sporanaerobium hydrogeniformans]
MKKSDFQMKIAITLLSFIILSGLLAPWLAPYDPNEIHMAVRLQGPSKEYLFGTDALGRDMLSRILYGGRASILLALIATTLSMTLGMIIGVCAGYFTGVCDIVLTVVTQIFQGIPGTCLMIAIAGILGPGMNHLLLALVVTSWAGFSRIVRTETLRIREQPYMEGLRALGAGTSTLLLKHLIPNMLPNVVVLFTTRVGRSVLSIASLSYLGLGLQPPHPDWSVMISDARLHYRSAPHLIIVPGLCMFTLLFAINLLGDALRDRMDVREEEVKEW